MNFNSIRVRYSIIFVGIGLLMAISSFLTFNLISDFEAGMNRFTKEYTPSISAVLNADRDLYQARVAEISALLHPNDKDRFAGNLESYQENAQQAYDRMHVLLDLLVEDEDIAQKVNGFESAFTT